MAPRGLIDHKYAIWPCADQPNPNLPACRGSPRSRKRMLADPNRKHSPDHPVACIGGEGEISPAENHSRPVALDREKNRVKNVHRKTTDWMVGRSCASAAAGRRDPLRAVWRPERVAKRSRRDHAIGPRLVGLFDGRGWLCSACVDQRWHPSSAPASGGAIGGGEPVVAREERPISATVGGPTAAGQATPSGQPRPGRNTTGETVDARDITGTSVNVPVEQLATSTAP
jgi:hypothetical protein